MDFFRLSIRNSSFLFGRRGKWTVHFQPLFQPTLDSSAGRAEDCRWLTKQRSLGHWFKSGSREVYFSISWQLYDGARLPVFGNQYWKETLLSNRIWTSDLRISALNYQLQSSALPAELSRDGRLICFFVACLFRLSIMLKQTMLCCIICKITSKKFLKRLYFCSKHVFAADPVAQWIARRTSNPEAVGSSPTGVVTLLYLPRIFDTISCHGCLTVTLQLPDVVAANHQTWKTTLGSTGIWTRDLAHPKRESYP